MLQKVIGHARRAIEDYNMIDEGDKIAVGLSGGKDSLTLLHTLYYLRKFYPKKFEIMAITIHPGSTTFNTEKLEELCKNLGIEYIVYKSDIAKVVFEIRKEKNPCSLCANMRRGMLNSIAIENGCNKIALGHTLDDLNETLLMSILLNGKIHTFSPVTYLSRSDVKVIRPLIYVSEKETRAVAKLKNFPVIGKCCPADGFTKRQYVKNLIKDIQKEIPKVNAHIFGAIKRSDIQGWKQENDN
ncbi:MAG: ATP-binding protein [Clostridia bacterium]